MKKYLIFFFLAVLLASTATAQLSSDNKITLREGETLKVGVKVTGLDSVSRAGATFRDVSSPAKIIKSWNTADGSMTLIGDSVYVFTMTSLETTGKATPGRWQFEVQSGAIGIKKTDVFPLEIYRATSLTGGVTPVLPGGYNYLFEFDFTATTPEFSVIESGIITVDSVSIREALVLKSDTSHTHTTDKITNWSAAWDSKFLTKQTNLRLAGDAGFVGPVGYGEYGLSVQNNSAYSYLEILNNGGAGKGAFFGLEVNNFTLYNWQGGGITFHTYPTSQLGATRLQILNDGNVIIGSESSTGEKLQVNGTMKVTGNTAFTGTVSGVTKSMVGLGNVDNTSDANKPVSTATQTALNTKPTLYNFNTYALALAGMSGVTGRHIVYVVADEVNNVVNGIPQEGWYMWNGTALKEILVL